MAKVKIKSLVNVYDIKKGDIKDVSPQMARMCVNSGNWELAEIVKVVKKASK